ncbi:MAG: epoxyqueuosine reductase QueH [Planctomycetes bacterium]|nr:epoxyqueuosine reductase QueH [Planctomycetota bacterium]
MKNSILVHICCGVCLSGLVEELRKRGFEPHGFFFNPNIHPFMEFQKRLRAVEVACEILKMPCHFNRQYGLNEFLCRLNGKYTGRCATCYEMRFVEVARYAKENGFSAFTTTLITSPRQNQLLIEEIARKAGAQYGVEFVCFSAIHLHEEGKKIAKKHSLYRQQYCGCVFSEYERYNSTERE